MVKKKTHEEYLSQIKEIHKGKPYNFDKVKYKKHRGNK